MRVTLSVAAACVAASVLALAGQPQPPQPAETITPSQAEAMIARFISSPDGARLGLRKVNDPERLSAIYGPYVDPRDGRIRSREWRVDPVKGTVLWPSMNSRVEGSFVNKGGEYVITAAQRKTSVRSRRRKRKRCC